MIFSSLFPWSNTRFYARENPVQRCSTWNIYSIVLNSKWAMAIASHNFPKWRMLVTSKRVNLLSELLSTTAKKCKKKLAQVIQLYLFSRQKSVKYLEIFLRYLENCLIFSEKIFWRFYVIFVESPTRQIKLKVYTFVKYSVSAVHNTSCKLVAGFVKS